MSNAVIKLEKNAIYLQNVTLFWSKVQEPHQGPYDDIPKYSTTVIMDSETVKELKKIKINKTFKEIGVDIDVDKYPDHEGSFICKFEQPSLTKAGKPLTVNVVNPEGKLIEDLIGNGSTGHLRLYATEGVGATKGKVNVRLNTVMVTDLVEYANNTDDVFGVTIQQRDALTKESTPDVEVDDDLDF
jgi:hypothetical protein